MSPQIAIVTVRTENCWWAFVAYCSVASGLVAGNERNSGKWFQMRAADCTVTYAPTKRAVNDR